MRTSYQSSKTFLIHAIETPRKIFKKTEGSQVTLLGKRLKSGFQDRLLHRHFLELYQESLDIYTKNIIPSMTEVFIVRTNEHGRRSRILGKLANID